MKEIISDSINFSVQLTTTPKITEKLEAPNHNRSRSNTLRIPTLFSDRNDSSEDLNKSNYSLISKASTIASTITSHPPKSSSHLQKSRSITPKRPPLLENIEMESKSPVTSAPNTPSHTPHAPLTPKTHSLLSRYVVYFYPHSNRFCIYSVIEATLKTVELSNKMFLEHSSWGICEGGWLIQTGGIDSRPRNTVFMFKLSTETVVKCPNMNYKRCKHAQVSLGSFVYVVGGYDKHALGYVERLNLLDFRWKKVGNLVHRRISPAACAHHSKLYVAGGEGVRSIEIFNALTKKFSLLSVNLIQPGKICMFGYDEKILILQGGEKQEWDPQNSLIKHCGSVEEREWHTQGEYFAMNNEIYFISCQTLYRYDITQSLVSLVKSLI